MKEIFNSILVVIQKSWKIAIRLEFRINIKACCFLNAQHLIQTRKGVVDRISFRRIKIRNFHSWIFRIIWITEEEVVRMSKIFLATIIIKIDLSLIFIIIIINNIKVFIICNHSLLWCQMQHHSLDLLDYKIIHIIITTVEWIIEFIAWMKKINCLINLASFKNSDLSSHTIPLIIFLYIHLKKDFSFKTIK